MATRKNSYLIQQPDDASCAFSDKCPIQTICSHVRLSLGTQPNRVGRLSQGTTLYRNDIGGLIVVRSGLLVSYAAAPGGGKIVFALVGSGYAVGGELAVGSNVSPTDSLSTVLDSEICILPYEPIKQALNRSPTLMVEIIEAAKKNESIFLKYSWIIQGKSILGKTCRFFSMCMEECGKGAKELQIPLSQESLAMIVCAERAHVSRALKTLEDRNVLKRRRNMLVVNDLGLKVYASDDDIWDVSVIYN